MELDKDRISKIKTVIANIVISIPPKCIHL